MTGLVKWRRPALRMGAASTFPQLLRLEALRGNTPQNNKRFAASIILPQDIENPPGHPVLLQPDASPDALSSDRRSGARLGFEPDLR
jgi:hypothetical protein